MQPEDTLARASGTRIVRSGRGRLRVASGMHFNPCNPRACMNQVQPLNNVLFPLSTQIS